MVAEVKYCDTNKPKVYLSRSHEVKITHTGGRAGMSSNYKLAWRAIAGRME